MAQDTDFQIPNGTGQAVRLDIERAILALASCSSGAQSGLGTTQPCQLFADTDNGLLKIRDTGGNAAASSATFHTIGSLNTANLGLLPRTGGVMTGVLTAAAGSNSAPSLNFGDSGTGFFKQSTNVVGFSGAGNLGYTFSNTSFNLRDQRSARFFDSDSSQYVDLKAPSNVTSNRTVTLPNESGTVLTSGTATITATTLRATNFQDGNGNNQFSASQMSALAGTKPLKAYVNLKGTGTVSIRQSHNVSSITDNEVGGYQVNFTNNMSSSNYIITHSISQDNAAHFSHGVCYIRNSTISTSSFKSRTFNDESSGATIDKVMVAFMVVEN